MAGNRGGRAKRGARKESAWMRLEHFLAAFNKTITYVIGLPAVGLIGTLLASHFQYVAAYQDKVQAVGKQQMDAAEQVFTDASTMFSKAITLQQLLYFNYLDAEKANRLGDPQSLEAQSANAIYPEYVNDRTDLRESIDLMARRVEIAIDWASDTARDAAHGGEYGGDRISRIALGAYDFQCDETSYMPSFKPGSSVLKICAPPELLKEKPKAKPLSIDWYSAKHHLLTLYFCFDKNHGRIETARRWAAGGSVSEAEKAKSVKQSDQIQKSFDDESVRLHDFLTLAARRIEKIRVKFRPRGWYCHVPLVRQLFDLFSNMCTPIRTAQNAEAS